MASNITHEEELRISQNIDSFLTKNIKESLVKSQVIDNDKYKYKLEKDSNLNVNNPKENKNNKIKIKLKSYENYLNTMNDQQLIDEYTSQVDNFKNFKSSIQASNYKLQLLKKILTNKPSDINSIFKNENNSKTVLSEKLKFIKNENDLLKEKIRINTKLLNSKKIKENLLIKKEKKRLIQLKTGNKRLKTNNKTDTKEELLHKIDLIKERLLKTESHVKKMHLYIKEKSWKISYKINKLEDNLKNGITRENTKESKELIMRLQSELEYITNDYESQIKTKEIYEKRVNEQIALYSKIKEQNNIYEQKLTSYTSQNVHSLRAQLDSLIEKESQYKIKLQNLMNDEYFKSNQNYSKIIMDTNEVSAEKDRKQNYFKEITAKNEDILLKIKEIKPEIKAIKEELLDIEDKLIQYNGIKDNKYKYINNNKNIIDNENLNIANNDAYLKILNILNTNTHLKSVKSELLKSEKIKNKQDLYDKIYKEKANIIDLLEIAKNELSEKMDSDKAEESKFNKEKEALENKIFSLKKEILQVDNIIGKITIKDNKPFEISYNKITKEEYYYDDNVSSFSNNTNDYELLKNNDDNLIDLYLGVFNIENKKYLNKNYIVNIEFLNLENSATELCNSNNINLVTSFVINCNKDNLKHLYKESIIIEIYEKDDIGDLCKLGSSKIELKDLIDNNSNLKNNKISSVINSYSLVKLLNNNDIIGSIQYKLRFRLPIKDNIGNIKDNYLNARTNLLSKNRNIIIYVEQGYEFPLGSKPFFTYDFFNNKYISDVFTGNKPNFNNKNVININYNNEFMDYIRNNKLEILFFDDSVELKSQITEDNDVSDYIGSCYINLNNLSYNKPVIGKYPIYKNNKSHCLILISIYYEDNNINCMLNDLKYDNIWESKVKKQIINSLKKSNLKLKNVFEYINKDTKEFGLKDNILYIDRLKFEAGIKKIVGDDCFTGDEIQALWQRIINTSSENNNNIITLLKIEAYFGDLLSTSMLLDQKSLEIKKFNKLLTQNSLLISKDDPSSYNLEQLIEKLKSSINTYLNKNNIDFSKFYILFDSDKSGKISKSEFLESSEKILNLKLSNYDVNMIFGMLDSNQSDSIDIKEFFNLLKLDYKELSEHCKTSREKLSVTNNEGSIKTDILTIFITDINNYITNNKLNIIDIYNIFDKNGDGNIEKTEFQDIIKNKLKLNYSNNEIDYIIHNINSDFSDSIEIKEFINFFDKQEFITFYSNKNNLGKLENSVILKNIYEYIINKEIDIYDFFKEFDEDNSGTISLLELNMFINKNKLNTSKQELEYFFGLLISADNKTIKKEISYEEFKTLLTSYDLTVKKAKDITNEYKYHLIRKIINVLKSKRKEYLELFKMYENKNKCVLYKKFMMIVEESNDFNNEEISAILYNLIISSYVFNYIYYESFLNIEESYKDFLTNYLTASDNIAITKIIEIINTSCLKNNIDNYTLYTMFTKSGTRKLDAERLQEVLYEMEITIDYQLLNNYLNTFDIHKDGNLSYREFCRFLGHT